MPWFVSPVWAWGRRMRCGDVGFHGPEGWCGSSFLVFVGSGSGRQVTAESFVAWCQAVVNAEAHGPMPGS